MRNVRPLPGDRRLGARGRLGNRDPDDDLYLAAPERRSGGALRGLRKIILGVLLVLGSVALAVSGVLGVLLYRHAHPPRIPSQETPESLFTKYEDASFTSSDGVPLSGWWIPGQEGLPALILCHDRGASRASLLGLAARLSAENYPVLLFDARGHGSSGGTSSFGVLEKRDVIGAIDWVGSNTKADGTRIGIAGVGMGAYAAILAAAERPQVRCLVLDSPYPDAGTEFAASSLPAGFLRSVLTGWSRLLYDLAYRVHSSNETAALHVRELNTRDLLFVAQKDREPVVLAARGLYDSVSEARNNFKNLELLPATRTKTLYGEERERYDTALIAFFRSYLPPSPRTEQARVPAHKPSAAR
jgi:pimeloyl-ACP methyl ester carboxylesterase